MRMLLAIGLVCCLMLDMGHADAAPRPPRPTAGIGVLEVRAFPVSTTLTATTVSLYREPGMGRLQEVPAGTVQLLAPVFGTATSAILMAVTERRGDWLRVVFDDAGREGWVRQERPWGYTPWGEYLKGRSAKLMPGLRKNFYQLFAEPVDSTGIRTSLAPNEEFRLVGIDGDWALVLIGQERAGWLRWRDRDSRFLVVVNPHSAAQKH